MTLGDFDRGMTKQNRDVRELYAAEQHGHREGVAETMSMATSIGVSVVANIFRKTLFQLLTVVCRPLRPPRMLAAVGSVNSSGTVPAKITTTMRSRARCASTVAAPRRVCCQPPTDPGPSGRSEAVGSPLADETESPNSVRCSRRMSLASGGHICPDSSHGLTGAVLPDASDTEIARVDDLVEAVRDETCCRHPEKPTAQPSRLRSERAE